VASASEVEEAVDSVLSEFGRTDVLVNAAGVIGAAGWEDRPTAKEMDWDVTYDVNVRGTVIACNVVSRHMKGRKTGKIVNISSHGGRSGSANNSAYGASKAAVIHLTQSYALELAPYDINVNAICPGSLWTPMHERFVKRIRRNDPAKSHMTLRQIFDQRIQELCPLGREQTPEDIGKAVAFFASDEAVNITGQALNVNGGTRMD
jgi:NAD(P)-dependent dehydrogenase (short-subunit alcohol dehydrogenase family)